MAYKATQFVAPEGAEVSGVLMLAYLNNLESEVTLPILKQYGFADVNFKPDDWYPNQMFLDIEKAIHDQPGGTSALVAIGKSAADNYIAPDDITSLLDAILALPGVYTTNQRNLPEGYGWIIEKVTDNHYVFTNNTGTTNHGAYGYIWSLCNKMKARGQNVSVTPREGFEHDSTEPGVIDITW